jgi:hypothetical protein
MFTDTPLPLGATNQQPSFSLLDQISYIPKDQLHVIGMMFSLSFSTD